MSAPIEVTTRYATTVDDLTSAWAFVMKHLDSCGDDPSIEIRPISTIGVADMQDAFDGRESEGWRRRFEVVVEGMVSHDSEVTR
jgi:hypothetical protein